MVADYWMRLEGPPLISSHSPPTHLVIKTLSGSSRFCEFTSERGGNFLRTYIFVASFKFLNSIPCAISKGSGVHLNKMHANSLTRLLFFQVFGLTELFCLLWCLYLQRKWDDKWKTFEIQFKRRTTRVNFTYKRKRTQKGNTKFIRVSETCGMTPRTSISDRPAGRWIFF